MILAHAVTIGFLAAVSWGIADFAGGLATRRVAPYQVVLIAHSLSAILLGATAWRVPITLSPEAVACGLLSGAAGSAALMVFYRALSMGLMGLAASLAGLLTALLPMLFALHAQGAPSPTQVLGFAVAAVAVVLITYAPRTAPTTRRVLFLSTVAGIGFGLQLIGLHESVAITSAMRPKGSVGPLLWTLLLSHAGSAAVALGVQLWSENKRRRLRANMPTGATSAPSRSAATAFYGKSVLGLSMLAGLLDTTGNGLYMMSSLRGRLDVAAVLASLYPGATIVMAAFFLKERTTFYQLMGMGTALVAVALIAA